VTLADQNRPVSDVRIGEHLPPVGFPLNAYRLVMWAGAGRDFNSIHHNTEWAQQTGAPDMYANTLMLMGGWERLVREWAGPRATITGIRGFRMRRFNVVGETITITGTVSAVDGDIVTVAVATSDSAGITVGPGSVLVRLPGASS